MHKEEEMMHLRMSTLRQLEIGLLHEATDVVAQVSDDTESGGREQGCFSVSLSNCCDFQEGKHISGVRHRMAGRVRYIRCQIAMNGNQNLHVGRLGLSRSGKKAGSMEN